MDKRQRRRLKSLLAQLDESERDRLTKRAAKLRKESARTRPPGTRGPDTDDLLLRLLDAGGRPAAAAAGATPPPDGIVVAVAAGTCRVLVDGEVLPAVLPGDLARRQKSGLAVGDEVILEPFGETRRVTAVLPRRSLLSRADPHDPRRTRAIAANIDVVVVTVAVQEPPLHPRLIDRYLVAVERSGARAVLAVNKVDLLNDAEREQVLALLQPYVDLAMPVVLSSVTTGEGIERLRGFLKGATCVFVGQSGVGKSSLLNALHADAGAKTGTVRAGDGRGRHTTSASSLYELGGGVRVIDTPGIRRFTVDDADGASFADGFTEFAAFAARCRYRDCTHVHEPDCAVRDAVRSGAIAESRYASYRKLLAGDGGDPQRGGDPLI
jgi:ribosome biogenesis GTPase